jgi:hypothetical protein
MHRQDATNLPNPQPICDLCRTDPIAEGCSLLCTVCLEMVERVKTAFGRITPDARENAYMQLVRLRREQEEQQAMERLHAIANQGLTPSASLPPPAQAISLTPSTFMQSGGPRMNRERGRR